MTSSLSPFGSYRALKLAPLPALAWMLGTLTETTPFGMLGLFWPRPACTLHSFATSTGYAEIFICDEAQQEAALSDIAILGALPRKCLLLRLGDPQQTSSGTGPGRLAQDVRAVSDRLSLGIRSPRQPLLPQELPDSFVPS